MAKEIKVNVTRKMDDKIALWVESIRESEVMNSDQETYDYLAEKLDELENLVEGGR